MLLAVPAAMSNQGLLSRYAEQVSDRGHGRLTVQANADRAYAGVLDLADAIDREQLADHAAVFRRGEARPRHAVTQSTEFSLSGHGLEPRWKREDRDGSDVLSAPAEPRAQVRMMTAISAGDAGGVTSIRDREWRRRVRLSNRL
jgi:Zeta toxin